MLSRSLFTFIAAKSMLYTFAIKIVERRRIYWRLTVDALGVLSAILALLIVTASGWVGGGGESCKRANCIISLLARSAREASMHYLSHEDDLANYLKFQAANFSCNL